jgi:hypothetical protein
MRPAIILSAVVALLVVVSVSCSASQLVWTSVENTADPVRELVGLPSIAVGNLNPSARNPGLEILCAGLYDTPGGYCSYFTDGVPFIDFPSSGNITLAEKND